MNEPPNQSTAKSKEWQEGFLAACRQASRSIGHFIIDEGGSEKLAEAAYDYLDSMAWDGIER